MAAHRHWRLYCRKNAGNGSFTGLSEIELRASASGADETGGGTAGSSGSIQAGTAAACFDNNTGTGIQWNGTGAGQYVSYDFGSGNDEEIVEVSVLPRHDAANRTFAEFDVQYSDDGSAWTTDWSGSYTAWVIGTPVVFTKPGEVAHRYWRVRLDENFLGTGGTFAVSEVEMKDTVGGGDQCSGGTASARTTFSGWPASNAFADDGTTSAYSSSGGSEDCEWLQYDFGSNKDIIEVTLLGRDDNDLWMQMPRTAWVESSPDARSFLSRWKYTNVVGDRAYTQRRIKPGHVPTAGSAHRFWGIKCNATQDSARVFGVAELEMRAAVSGATICAGGAGCSKIPWTNSSTDLTAARAFDGATTGYGGNVANGGGDILAYDFGVGDEVALPVELMVQARVSGGSANEDGAPTDFDLVYSDDGESWTVQQNFTTTADWTSGETRTFLVNQPANARRRQLVNC